MIIITASNSLFEAVFFIIQMKSLRTFSLLTSGQSAGDMQTADRKNLNKEKETKL